MGVAEFEIGLGAGDGGVDQQGDHGVGGVFAALPRQAAQVRQVRLALGGDEGRQAFRAQPSRREQLQEQLVTEPGGADPCAGRPALELFDPT